MKNELSILIPLYNGRPLEMISELCRQADTIGSGLRMEVVVCDDGSTDEETKRECEELEQMPKCRVIHQENCGRSVTRNRLAREAKYEWLLFIDCDMTIIRADFIKQYLESDATDIAYGGYEVGKGEKSSLRYIYEKEAAPRHTAEERAKRPYADFHTSNFLIRRDLMMAHPLDERFRHYGYEDVLLGKHLRQSRAVIKHIDNPVGFNTFESNADFISKTEEGMRTLHEFRKDLRGYVSLLTFVDGIHLSIVKCIIRLWHRLFGNIERRWLTGERPSVKVFTLYKIGYFLSLEQ